MEVIINFSLYFNKRLLKEIRKFKRMLIKINNFEKKKLIK